jgi:broad specificity phosphatase PhoE
VTPELWLVRHGATEWSEDGRHTGVTDLPLLDEGRVAAAALAPVLGQHSFVLALTSPRRRARETAALAGFPDAEIDDDLCEWNYGELEGLTIAQIRARGDGGHDWTVFTGPVPGGETLAEVAARARAVLARVRAAGGDVICFTHGHIGRVLTAVALDLDPAAGAHLALDPATLNVVASEHEVPVLREWNRRP